jgi:hypothetical protein
LTTGLPRWVRLTYILPGAWVPETRYACFFHLAKGVGVEGIQRRESEFEPQVECEVSGVVDGSGSNYVMDNGDGYVKRKRTGMLGIWSCMPNRKWLSLPLDHGRTDIGEGGEGLSR